MVELKNVVEKEKIASDLRELVDKINKIITVAPPFLTIRVTQNEGFNHGVNSFVNLWVEEKIIY